MTIGRKTSTKERERWPIVGLAEVADGRPAAQRVGMRRHVADVEEGGGEVRGACFSGGAPLTSDVRCKKTNVSLFFLIKERY